MNYKLHPLKSIAKVSRMPMSTCVLTCHGLKDTVNQKPLKINPNQKLKYVRVDCTPLQCRYVCKQNS